MSHHLKAALKIFIQVPMIGSPHARTLLSTLKFLTNLIRIWFSSVQSLSGVRLFATPWIAARQASLSVTNSQSLPKLMSIELVMPSSYLILCRPLLLLLPIPPSIRVFSNESTLCMRCPKYWSFSFSIIPSKEHPGLVSFRMDWLDNINFFLPVLLRYNWITALYKIRAYNIMSWFSYMMKWLPQ